LPDISGSGQNLAGLADQIKWGSIMKVLIIDDDPLVRYTLSKILTSHGYEVATAVNGERGFASLVDENPAVVITDLIMPEQEGIETIIRIRREHPNIRIIAISGGGRYGNFDLLPMAQSLGADVIISKPFEAEELLGPLKRLSGMSSGPEADAA
jgi:CheY-like chemotaxis protein